MICAITHVAIPGLTDIGLVEATFIHVRHLRARVERQKGVSLGHTDHLMRALLSFGSLPNSRLDCLLG